MATENVNRSYKGADSYMLENGQTLHDLFLLDLTDFVAKVPDLDDPFAVDWQDAIDAAIAYTDDFVIQGQIAPKTFSVKEAMKAGSDKYTEVIFYAAQHFGKNSPDLQQFGKGKAYDAAIRSQEKMFQFLDELSATANKYKTQLIAKGYTQAAIDEIATLRDALSANNTDQNLAIKGRLSISQGRTIAYNLAYSYQRKVIDAAQIVYRTNPAKLAQYTYNPPINHRPAHRLKIEVKAGIVTDLKQQQNNIQPPLPEPLELQPIEKVRFTATGSSFTIYLTETPDSPPTGKQLQIQPGKMHNTTIQKLAQQLGVTDNMKYAYAQNTGLQKGTLTITYYPNEE